MRRPDPRPAQPGASRPARDKLHLPAARAEPGARPAQGSRGRPSAPPQRAADATRSGLRLYGVHAVAAALRNPARRLRRLLLTEEAEATLAAAAPKLWPLAAERIDRARLDQMLGRDAVHQGMGLLADPMVGSDPNDLQSWNNDSYGNNNPMAFSDPGGLCSGVFGCIGAFFGHIGHEISVFLRHNEVLNELLVIAADIGRSAATAGVGTPAYVGVIQATDSILDGHKIGAAVESGAIAGAEAEASSEVGANTGLGQARFGSAHYFENVAGHSLVGGTFSVIQDGSFQSGALAAGFSASVSPYLPHDAIEGIAASAVVGGTASVLGGGKFGNGALTGSFGYLFNTYVHQQYRPSGQLTADQLQGSIYNETSSLSGDGIYEARVDIGYVAENRVGAGIYGGMEDGNISAQEQGAIQAGYGPAVTAFTQSGQAAQQVLQTPGGDPTGGAKYFYMGGANLPDTVQGQPLSMQLGPFHNAVPSAGIPSNTYIGIYGRRAPTQ